MLDRKQSELGTGRGSYVVILLVSPLGSVTIAKFNGVGVHCFVVALFLAFTYTMEYPAVYYCMWTIYVNITGNIVGTAVHPQPVGTRLSFSSHAAWVQD